MRGRCCHFDIPLDLDDIERIAKHLRQPSSEIFQKYVREGTDGPSPLLLAKKPDSQVCVFLTDGRACGIYLGRPTVCRSYLCAPALEALRR